MTTFDQNIRQPVSQISNATITARGLQNNRNTFDDQRSKLTDVLLPTDYLNSRSSSEISQSSMSHVVLTDLKHHHINGNQDEIRKQFNRYGKLRQVQTHEQSHTSLSNSNCMTINAKNNLIA